MSVSKYLKEIGKPVAYYPKLARALESVGAAVFLCQLLYWDGKGEDAEGWIYKTQVEVEQETGLTRRKQESARKALKEHGILDEQRRGTHGTLHFKINLPNLDIFWSEYISANVQNGHSSMYKTANDECTKPPNANGANRQTLIKDAENTTEITAKSISEIAGEVLADYSATVGRDVSKLKFPVKQKWLTLIENRLREEWTPEDLHQIFVGCTKDKWPDRRMNNGILDLLTKYETMDRMMNIAEQPERQNGNGNGREKQTTRPYDGSGNAPEVSSRARKIADRFKGSGTAGSSL